VCGACPRRPDCTAATDGRRSVGISDSHEELCAADAYNRTAAFQATMKLLPPIEAKLSNSFGITASAGRATAPW